MIKKRTVVRNSDFAPGDIFKMNSNPIKGYEQKEYRPFLILSKMLQEVSLHMLFVAPIISKTKEYPLHVPLVTKHCIVT
ncbi:type II toxin-antitoxin system PemK/MazF family toxin [uncultured Vagococcus sp.]|uniref:type II toxin-antitoxin system PemK/MazF family toxin n=1 Tax=uncultured Vagococcus sp. TaxID=189676 RepID=UPI0028D876BF|nr:type II toxin-antitoxin system PemK/MazF family toxin [uncultured Vagococcus sp.]